jgi:hypothetical protein
LRSNQTKGDVLDSVIVSLANETRRLLERHEEKGAAIKVKIPRLRARITRFKCDKGAKSYAVDHEPKEVAVWAPGFVEQLNEEITNQATYKQCVDRIAKEDKMAEDQARHYCDKFVRSILARASYEEITEDIIQEHVFRFVRDVGYLPTEWTITAWLDGIWVEANQRVEIGSWLTLRRPDAADLERAYSIEARSITSLIGGAPVRSMPSAILEMNVSCKDQNDAAVILDRAVILLRMFRLASVVLSRVEYAPRSIIRLPVATHPSSFAESPYEYSLTKEDDPALRELFDRMNPLVTSSTWEAAMSNDHLDIALTRYNEALIRPATVESRITSAITCLEALFLKAGERGELSMRLALRVAALLQHFGFVPWEVHKRVSRAYKVRSAFVHGAAAKRHRGQLGELCWMILEYCRVALLLFYQLKETVTKDSMVAQLDRSLLDDAAVRKLKDGLSDTLVTS